MTLCELKGWQSFYKNISLHHLPWWKDKWYNIVNLHGEYVIHGEFLEIHGSTKRVTKVQYRYVSFHLVMGSETSHCKEEVKVWMYLTMVIKPR